jgi:hypothetical protein
MTRALLAGIAALFLATGTAHAECCDMPKLKPAVAHSKSQQNGTSAEDFPG